MPSAHPAPTDSTAAWRPFKLLADAVLRIVLVRLLQQHMRSDNAALAVFAEWQPSLISTLHNANS